jgi:hypothetical protein
MRKGNIRVGGEAMMRGGVTRMRWRARARRGVTETGGGFVFSADMGGQVQRATVKKT